MVNKDSQNNKIQKHKYQHREFVKERVMSNNYCIILSYKYIYRPRLDLFEQSIVRDPFEIVIVIAIVDYYSAQSQSL